MSGPLCPADPFPACLREQTYASSEYHAGETLVPPSDIANATQADNTKKGVRSRGSV